MFDQFLKSPYKINCFLCLSDNRLLYDKNCLTCKSRLKIQEEKKEMKHSCGKVFDVDKPVKTRKGKNARIICKDSKSIYPIIALIGDETEDAAYYGKCGHYWMECNDYLNDLINFDEPIDWTKPICVVNEVSGKIYDADVKAIGEEYVVVAIDHTFTIIFSVNGKPYSNSSTLKFIAKNI